MKLIEGTHYRRRIDQPSPHLARSKEFVECLICRLPSDSEEEEGRTTLRRKQAKDGIRRRLDQPSSHPTRAKEFVDCLFCDFPSDSEDEQRHTTLTRRQARDGILNLIRYCYRLIKLTMSAMGYRELRKEADDIIVK